MVDNESFSEEVMSRLPLAQATLEVLAHAHSKPELDDLFNRQAGASYERFITFADLLGLLGDALLQRGGNLAATIDLADEQGRLAASRTAYYGKLRRIPLALSVGYLRHASTRLVGVAPVADRGGVPNCLQHFEVRIMDGKKLKNVPKTLLSSRGAAGKLFGGKLLVSWNPQTGLVDGMAADPDGEANECKLVPPLLAQYPDATPEQPWLWVADRQFGDLKQPAAVLAKGHHFLFRRNGKTHFHADPTAPVPAKAEKVDRQVIEQHGTLGSGKNPLKVRQLTLHRAGAEDVVVVTSLLDSKAYPAADLLELYRKRWKIEGVFQEITEIFGLARFVGSSPQATVFQAAICLMLYNAAGVVQRVLAAATRRKEVETSARKLFASTREELVSAFKLVPLAELDRLQLRHVDAAGLRERLIELLSKAWRPRYQKAAAENNPRPRKVKKKASGAHTSVHRLQQKHRQEQAEACEIS